jgi:RNA polymerase sigma-70 factor (ECF subfamily)
LLFKKYSRGIQRIIERIVLDEHKSEDIMQEVFLKVYKNLGKFKFKSSVFTWLYRIAVNTALSYKASRKASENELGEQTLKTMDNQVESNFEKENIKNRIKEAVNTLPKKQRAIFTLRFYEKMPFKDVANILKIKENAAKVNFHHALGKLKNMLEDLL